MYTCTCTVINKQNLIFSLSLSFYVSFTSDPSEGMKTFMDISSEVESSSMKNSGLSFDPNYFKANKEVRNVLRVVMKSTNSIISLISIFFHILNSQPSM